jgi:hypothetical protein
MGLADASGQKTARVSHVSGTCHHEKGSTKTNRGRPWFSLGGLRFFPS